MKYKHRAVRDFKGLTQHIVCDRAEGAVARAAVEMVVKWGMVAGVPDGEDSSGRQQLRLATPEELTKRAIETAALMYEKLEKTGHLIDTSEIFDVLETLEELI